MDLTHDLFRMAYRQGVEPDPAAALAAVRSLNFKPSIADPAEFKPKSTAARPRASVPPVIQRLLDTAKAERKLAIVKLTGEG